MYKNWINLILLIILKENYAYIVDLSFVIIIRFSYSGWCSIVFGLSASIFSYLLGKLAKYIGLQTIIVMMLLVGLGHSIFMISWTPDYSQGGYVVFLMAATFGFTCGLATAQVRAIFGVFFPKDPSAYSAAILFETFGHILGSVLSIFFQARVKIYVYTANILVSLVSYVYLEVRHRNRHRNENDKQFVANESNNNLASSHTNQDFVNSNFQDENKFN